MKTFEVEYYEVYESYDRDINIVARFTNYQDALKLKNTSNYYNCHGSPITKSFSVFESYKEYQDFKNYEPRRKALAKLTIKERQLLGLE